MLLQLSSSQAGTSKNCHFPGTGKLAGPYETFSRTDFLKMRRQAHWRASLNFSRCPVIHSLKNIQLSAFWYFRINNVENEIKILNSILKLSR